MAPVNLCLIQSAWKLTRTQEKQIMQKLRALVPFADLEFSFQTDPSLLTGLRLTVNGMEFDLTAAGSLHQLSALLNHKKNQDSRLDWLTTWQHHTKKIKKNLIVQEVGTVVSVSDGIVVVRGFQNVALGERLTFHSHARGLVLNLQKEVIEVGLLDTQTEVQEGERVYRSYTGNTIGVGEAFLGRVVDPTGKPLDDKGMIEPVQECPLNPPAPLIVERAKVQTPFHTGIMGIDTLIPIGHGQRELIVGDRQTGKTALLLDMILAQKQINETAKTPKDKVYCVYVAIGQKQATVRSFVQTLADYNVLQDTIIVSASAATTATMQYLAPYAGCTLAEYFRDKGMRAVVFYDDLTKHAVAYREMSLLLKRPGGREAYPGDIFYIHAKLLERAAQLSPQKGGGSLTAIPVIETQEGDVSAYIPTNVISITDGQIFLQTDLFNQGFRPAIDIGLSVSRVGGNAQTPALKKMASHLKLELAQYHEMLNFSQFETDLDSASQNLLQQGARFSELLKQSPCHPLTASEEAALLFIATEGLLSPLPLDQIIPATGQFLTLLRTQHASLLATLTKHAVLTEDAKDTLKEVFLHITEHSNEPPADIEAQN